MGTRRSEEFNVLKVSPGARRGGETPCVENDSKEWHWPARVAKIQCHRLSGYPAEVSFLPGLEARSLRSGFGRSGFS